MAFLCLWAPQSQAQQDKGKHTIIIQEKEPAEKAVKDTLALRKHNPRVATMISIVPGLGQIYNRRYWKVPVIYGSVIGLLYLVEFNDRQYKLFKEAYANYDSAGPYEFDYDGSPSFEARKEQYLSLKDFYRRNRDLSIIGLAFVYLLNVIDANVDAYLIDYDVTPSLALRAEPVMMPNFASRDNSLNMGLKFSFKF